MKESEIIKAFIKGTLNCSNILCGPNLKEHMRLAYNWSKEEYDKNYEIYSEWVEKQ